MRNIQELALLNAVCLQPDARQPEPRILRRLDIRHFDCIQIWANFGQRMIQRTNYSLLRRRPRAAPRNALRRANEMPLPGLDLRFKTPCAGGPKSMPAVSKIVRGELQALGHFSLQA